jgi:16S rRNA (guanine527-N7)-methyltransferase
MRDLYGSARPTIEHLAALLAEHGETRGLLGPRELDRLWERHLDNCAALAPELAGIGSGGSVIDIGSGAGLPGLVLAALRPELNFELVDSMRRRTDWLTFASKELRLTNVAVSWCRAEALAKQRAAQAVVSRAVARLDRLAKWCGPLLEEGGVFLALKGASAAQELNECGPALDKAALRAAEVVELATGPGGEVTFVVKATKQPRQTDAAKAL